MGRLIEADELKTAFPCGETVRTESVRATIDHMPTVDAVEVVRCKDCKHNPLDTWFDCPISHLKYDDDRWCWKGERKDGDNG